VKTQAFHFEIKDLVTQFVAAFDDIIIKRYDKDRVPQSSLQVRYIYAPKQRVLYDLVNKAQNLTLPAVAINITSVSRDESRVFNKLTGFYLSRGAKESDYKPASAFYRTPVPVNIGISMSIIAKFQTDMDQIISNFVPYNNPYIILSWKVPEGLIAGAGASRQEIRSEVLWDGSVNLSYPTDIATNEKYRLIGDTAFTIKGWLFPEATKPSGNIYYIHNNFSAESLITTYDSLSDDTQIYPLSTGLVSDYETNVVSGAPQITNLTSL